MLDGNQNLSWSAKHTRLRYQMVFACLGMVLISKIRITAFKVPGFFEFAHPPGYATLWLGLLGFAVFSLFAFYYQTKLERAVLIFSGDRTVEELRLLLETQLPGIQSTIPSFSGGVAGRAMWENLAERKKVVAQFDAKKFKKNSLIANDCYLSLSKFHDESLDRLSFWRSDFDALLPDVAVISGAYVTELRRMNNLIDKTEEAYERFSKSWAYFESIAPAAISTTPVLPSKVDGGEFTYAVNEVEKYLKLMSSSFVLFKKFGDDVLAGVRKNNTTFKYSSDLLAEKIPFWLSIGLLVLSAYYSAINVYDFWELHNAK